MPTTTIITKADYNYYASHQGTLFFPGKYYDCLRHCDTRKLHKKFPQLNGKRILKVLITTEEHEDYNPEVNRDIVMKHPLFCLDTHPEKEWHEETKMWVSKYIVGNAVIVVD